MNIEGKSEQSLLEELQAERAENQQLREALQEKERELFDREMEAVEYSARAENLQRYLDLFLHHPVYRFYKLLKGVFLKVSGMTGENEYPDYAQWQKLFEPSDEELNRQRVESQNWSSPPALSIVTAVYKPPLSIFEETVRSVLAQTYSNWTWHLADASNDDALWQQLQNLAKQDSRIRPVQISENQGIAANMNVALRNASGEFIVVLDHDDTLAPFALYVVADAIRSYPETDFLYSDADKLDQNGDRCEPLFKPDWSPEMMLCCNLMNQLSVYRRSLLDWVGYLDPDLDGAQDWDLYLRIAEKTDKIIHIPQILYHWRKTPHSTAQSISNKPYARRAQLIALRRHLLRLGLEEPRTKFLATHPIHCTHPVSSWSLSTRPLVSIILCPANGSHESESCVKRIQESCSYQNIEVIAQTAQPDGAGSWSRACNAGAGSAHGELLLFLDPRVEVKQSDWIELLAQWFELSSIGIVAAKMISSRARLQQAGTVLGLPDFAASLFSGERENTNGIFGSDGWYRNVSAVSGSCLMIRKKLFELLHGFDEQLIEFADVDLCLRAREQGHRIVYTPHVRLFCSATPERNVSGPEYQRMIEKWLAVYCEGDPYFNRNLSCNSATPHFRRNAEDVPFATRIQSSLAAR